MSKLTIDQFFFEISKCFPRLNRIEKRQILFGGKPEEFAIEVKEFNSDEFQTLFKGVKGTKYENRSYIASGTFKKANSDVKTHINNLLLMFDRNLDSLENPS